MSDEVLIFIDAGFLSKVSKHFGDGEYVKFKIKDFVRNICSRNNFVYEKIFYYTAPPYQSNNFNKSELIRKERYDSFKSSLAKEGFIFREGRVQRLKVDGKFIYRQKGVDTLLTIDLSNIKEDYPEVEKIILVSSDTYFCPVIKDITERGLEVLLFTYFDKKRGSSFSLSNHLLRVCSNFVKLIREDFK